MYNDYTLVPFSFLVQFRKISISWMIGINLLSLIKALEINADPVNLGMSITLLIIAALTEIFSDLRRKKADIEENNIGYIKMIDDKEESIIAEDIQVGDIIQIYDG